MTAMSVRNGRVATLAPDRQEQLYQSGQKLSISRAIGRGLQKSDTFQEKYRIGNCISIKIHELHWKVSYNLVLKLV